MIPRTKDICTCHGLKRVIVSKKGGGKYCQEGNKKRLSEKKAFVKATLPKSEDNEYGQAEVFRQIAMERPHTSAISGVQISNLRPINFFHILGKGAYPKYKLLKENILIVTAKEHEDWHQRRHELKNKPEWRPIFEKYDELKTRYNNTYK